MKIIGIYDQTGFDGARASLTAFACACNAALPTIRARRMCCDAMMPSTSGLGAAALIHWSRCVNSRSCAHCHASLPIWQCKLDVTKLVARHRCLVPRNCLCIKR
jgi:hypothetical protein